VLEIRNIEKLKDPVMTSLLKDFQRTFGSKYKVIAHVHGDEGYENTVVFIDSRKPFNFVTGDSLPRLRDMLGYIEQGGKNDHGKMTYKITSRLVENEKFRSHSHDHRVRKCVSIPVFLKHMKKYLLPFSPEEMVEFSRRDASRSFSQWVSEARNKWDKVVLPINGRAILEEVQKLKAMGIKPQTKAFEDVYATGVDAYSEYQRRDNRLFANMSNVFINPDETVTVTRLEDSKAMTTEYQSLGECETYIQEGITMLNMVEGNTYVGDVGLRTSHNTYWIDKLE
jgi:hypothetical protein